MIPAAERTEPAHADWIRRSFFIAGPTAVGKTSVAVAVAEACGGEIVGADAFQIYAGLDWLTAKPSPEELARVPHHLVGIAPLGEPYNVARYLEAALAAIAGILARGKLPVVAGGTGLYLRALTRGLSDAPPSSPELRDTLTATPLPELVARLASLDPAAAATIDLKNPRRVVRALEVVILSGKPFASFRQEWERSPEFAGVLLERPREELNRRIDERVVAMFRQGVVQEVADAAAANEKAECEAIGWNEIRALLRGEMRETDCIAAIQQATRQYAKRQMTWFRKEPMFVPVALGADADGAARTLELAKLAAVKRAAQQQ